MAVHMLKLFTPSLMLLWLGLESAHHPFTAAHPADTQLVYTDPAVVSYLTAFLPHFNAQYTPPT